LVTEIKVSRIDDQTFRVEVRERGGSSVHQVSAPADVVERYGGAVSAERLIEASFEFLLEREPKESILSRFELPVIERYFPEYPREIGRRLG
jgi:hypothetical protein